MRLIRVLAAIALLIIMNAGVSFAESGQLNPGSGNLGFTMMVGYNASYIDYKETVEGLGTQDRDYGYLNGLDAEVRYENGLVWTRFTADYSWTNNATYDGGTWGGDPLKFSTHEGINLYEGDLGFKVLNVETSTLTPYVGIGRRIWRRGTDTAGDYTEKYSWYFAAAGLNYVWRNDRLTAGADVAALIPFNMEVTTNFAGQAAETTLKLKTRVGFEAQLPLSYDVYRNHVNSRRFFLFLTPYYQYWAIGASEPVSSITIGGIVYNGVYEPNSRADIYGVKMGAGVNF